MDQKKTDSQIGLFNNRIYLLIIVSEMTFSTLS